MQVLLLNIDSKLPNIALKKIEMYHKLQGDKVTWDKSHFFGADKVYASVIFTKSMPKFDKDYLTHRPGIEVGGTGYDLMKVLPPEIDGMRLRINYGFTTRGCIRKCKFCFVPEKEGNIKAVGDIYEVWDGISDQVILFDNNILALPLHFEKICNQLTKEKLKVDFNQGLDIRLLTPSVCELLNGLRLSNGIRFAFDHPNQEEMIRNKVAMLRKHYKRKYIFFYVLVGFDTTFEEDMGRLEVIKELGCRAYVMRHENTPEEKRYIRMAEWVNQFRSFAKYDFETFCVKYDEYKHRSPTIRE